MVILKTIVGNLSANVNEITFTDATINSNSIIEVYYNSNDIYTVETWQRENTIGIVTSDHNFPVSVKVLINNVVAFEPYDDTSLVNRIDGLEDRIGDAEDAISALAGRVGDAEDDIDALENAVSGLNTSKQNVLTAGDNITIENDVISASGGSNDYSTTEKVIGQWTDGKTLYRIVKEIPFSSLSTDGAQRIYDYRNDFPNCDIKKISGYSISSTYGICNLGSRNYKQNSQSATYYEFSQYYGFPALRSSESLSVLNTSIKPDLVLTFEYTKTTD